MAWLAHDEARLDPVVGEEAEDEVADGVVADARQQRGLQPEPSRSDADVRRRAADVGREARDLLERGADVVRVEVDRRAAHVERVVRTAAHRSAMALNRRMFSVNPFKVTVTKAGPLLERANP